MDLNYLYHRHQVALFRSANAASASASRAHQGMADGYAEMISLVRQSAGSLAR